MAFSYSRSLTIDHTKCGSSDSSSFPVLVSASDATLKDAAHSGHVQSATGADILFFSDSALTTQIPSEIDFYDNVNGVLAAWVQAPTVSHTADTVIYIAYGNASPPARTANPWDANYKGVWHLGNGTALSAADSTTNAANGTINGGVPATAGKIDGGASFAADTTKYISVANGVSGPFAALGNIFTMEAWISSTSTARKTLFSWNEEATTPELEIDNTAGEVSVIIAGAFEARTNAAIVPNDGTLHHIAYTKNGAGATHAIYVDGVAQALVTNNAVTYASPTNPLWIGRRDASRQPWAGKLDELRISTAARGADWILTEYNNQNAPGNIGTPGFLTWGSELLLSSQQQFSMLGCGS